MLKKVLIFIIVISSCTKVTAQTKDPITDTTINYDDLFSALDEFLDSILAPRTFVVFNVGIANQNFNYTTKNSLVTTSSNKIITSPSLGYYHKSGLGISGAASIINDQSKFNPYQFSLSGSYDYIQNLDFATGINYTKYFTKDSLAFYTTPLNNAINAYFSYNNLWLKPGVSFSYGWGSRTEVEEREEQITIIRGRSGNVGIGTGTTTIDTRESVIDFSATASIRHDFYWLDLMGDKSYLKLTPQINFVSGTQRFGLNETTTSYGLNNGKNKQLLYNSENIQLDDELKFQPLSLTAFLKTEAGYGKFYLQPQLMFDYYFPAKENNFSTAFALNIGVSF